MTTPTFGLLGATMIANMIIGLTTYPYFDNTHCAIGAGDTATAPSNSQSDLQAASGATHQYRQGMDATFPTQTGSVITFRSTFATGNGNFAAGLLEIGIFNSVTQGPTSGNMLTRDNPNLGIKPNTQSWQITVTLTLS